MQLQEFLSPLRRAVEDYHMIEEGDRIAVGVSGGKDSLSLLCGLHELSKFYPKHFTVVGLTLDMGFPGSDYSAVADFCAARGIPYFVKQTDIKTIVFDIRKESNPCSLCARMRRGALHDFAKEQDCHKVALGHHKDDVVETFFLSLLYEGRLSCFAPVTYLSRKQVTVLRPMIYITESEIKGFAKTQQLPVAHSLCPADGNTKREQIKGLVRNLNEEYTGVKNKTFTAIKNSRISGWNDGE